MKPKPTHKPCMTPDCGRANYARGLCYLCYNTARRLIKEGRTTWDAVVKAGKALPAHSTGPSSKRVDWFLN